MVKKDIVKKISQGMQVTNIEIKCLLQSSKEEFKSFGIKGVRNQPNIEFLADLHRLVFDKNNIVASDALECCAEIDPIFGVKIAKKLLFNTDRFVQASAVYVIGKYADEKMVPVLQKAYINAKTRWRRIGILVALYKLQSNKVMYLDEVITILYKTKDYHTQCAALNALDEIRNRKERKYIIAALQKFRLRSLPVAVQSSLESVFGKN